MFRKLSIILLSGALACSALTTGAEARGGGGGHGGGFGGGFHGGLGFHGDLSGSNLGIVSQGAAMNNQIRTIAPPTALGPQISEPRIGNPVSQSTLSGPHS